MTRDLQDIQKVTNARWVEILLTKASAMAKYPLTTNTDYPSIPAFIDSNRLIVNCPSCNAAMFVDRADLRFFCCNTEDECFNSFAGDQWIRVSLPVEYNEIDRLLSLRPFIKNRNFLVSESVEIIRAENVAHEVAV